MQARNVQRRLAKDDWFDLCEAQAHHAEWRSVTEWQPDSGEWPCGVVCGQWCTGGELASTTVKAATQLSGDMLRSAPLITSQRFSTANAAVCIFCSLLDAQRSVDQIRSDFHTASG